MEWIPIVLFAAVVVWFGYSALTNVDEDELPLDEEEVEENN